MGTRPNSEIYRGSDSKVRIIKVRTKSGELKRAVAKTAVFPIDN